MTAKAKAKFVVFEGLDGVGKSTQAKLLAQRRGAIYTKQPGDHNNTKALKDILLSPTSQISNFVESLIFTVDRSIHVEEVLRPALAEGKSIVCDRYVGSFLAYQGYGRGGDLDFLKNISEQATGGLEPDLVILLKSAKLTQDILEADRIEGETKKFKKKVWSGYIKQLKENPETWYLVDADGSREEVAQKINDLVVEKLDWT